MRDHYLKVATDEFKEIFRRKKLFEIRENDSDFQVGEMIIFREYKDTGFTGRSAVRKITYISDYAQQGNYIVMAIY